MNEQPTRSTARPRTGAQWPFALAAGLVVGHLVDTMGRSGPGDALTAVSALVFVAAAIAGTVCALAALSSPLDAKRARSLLPGLVITTGAGVVTALLPGLI